MPAKTSWRSLRQLEGKELPERLRRATVSFAEIAKDALAYSEAHKRSYRDDKYRMKRLLEWFGPCAAESITPQNIEQALADAAESSKVVPRNRESPPFAPLPDVTARHPERKSAGESRQAGVA